MNKCTKEKPWQQGDPVPVEHTEVAFVRECADSCCSFFQCRNCGVEFRHEYGD